MPCHHAFGCPGSPSPTLITPIERNTVRNIVLHALFVDDIVSLLGIILDERFSTYIETAEDAHAEEVYYCHMKMNRHTIDENDLDEERM